MTLLETHPVGKKIKEYAAWAWAWITWWWFNEATSPYRIIYDRWHGPAPVRGWWAPAEDHCDPMAGLVSWTRRLVRRRVYLGLDQDNAPALADDDNAVLVLGPPGSKKTVGILIQNVLMAAGAVLCISTRVDIFMATARVRARFGTVWHFSAVGLKLRGAKVLRFSPLQGCEDDDYAGEVAKRIATWIDRSEYALQSGVRSYPYFAKRAAMLLKAFFRIAVVLGHDMGWVYQQLTAADFRSMVIKLRRSLEADETLWSQLEASVHSLEFVASISAEERGSILGTVANALEAYASTAVVEHSREPNFDPDNFVHGDPDQILNAHGMPDVEFAAVPWLFGRYDTLYITDASAESPCAIIYAEIEYRIRQAAYELAEECELEGKPQPQSILVANDEGAGIPPFALGKFLAERRNRGVMFIMVLQSMQQAHHLWGEMGKGFLTLFPTIVVLPGLRDHETLQTLSMLSGTYWIKITTRSTQHNMGSGLSHGDQDGYQQIPNLRPDQIATGHPEWPDGALVLSPPAAFRWVNVIPYFRDAPWPALIVNSLEHNIDEHPDLPLPPLALNRDFTYLDALGLGHRFAGLTQRIEGVRHA